MRQHRPDLCLAKRFARSIIQSLPRSAELDSDCHPASEHRADDVPMQPGAAILELPECPVARPQDARHQAASLYPLHNPSVQWLRLVLAACPASTKARRCPHRADMSLAVQWLGIRDVVSDQRHRFPFVLGINRRFDQPGGKTCIVSTQTRRRRSGLRGNTPVSRRCVVNGIGETCGRQRRLYLGESASHKIWQFSPSPPEEVKIVPRPLAATVLLANNCSATARATLTDKPTRRRSVAGRRAKPGRRLVATQLRVRP